MQIRTNIDLDMNSDPVTQVVGVLNQQYITSGSEVRLKIEDNKLYIKETILSDFILCDIKMECQPNTYVDSLINNVFVEISSL